MTAFLLNAPAGEPVVLADLKSWLRIDTSAEDDALTALLVAARLMVESQTRRMLLTQVWRVSLDAWPQDATIRVPFAPFQNVVAIRVFDQTGIAQTLSPATWTLDANPEAARLLFTTAPPPPGRRLAGIELDLTFGYGAAPASVPEPLRQAIRMLAARWYENRGESVPEARGGHVPDAVAAILAPFRRMRLK